MGIRQQWVSALVFGMSVSGCASDDGNSEFNDCAMGDLTGTWRAHYDEVNGNCGPIADETALFDPDADPGPGCIVNNSIISDDKCRADMDFSCPTTDDRGTQDWVMVMRHVGPGRLSGTATVQVNHPAVGTCRSTYNVTITQL
jgi:hypothetical protein